MHCVPDGQQEELRDEGEELEAPLGEVLVLQAGVRAGLGLAQFLSGEKERKQGRGEMSTLNLSSRGHHVTKEFESLLPKKVYFFLGKAKFRFAIKWQLIK